MVAGPAADRVGDLGRRCRGRGVAAETKATIRCIPFNRTKESGKCMVTGKPSEGHVVFAKAY